MMKSVGCIHLLLAFFLSCVHVSAALAVSGGIDNPLVAAANQSALSDTLGTALPEAVVHAEPLMDVTSLKKLGSGLPDIAVTSLYEMGFTQGNVFEGASSEHEFSVFFPLPVDSAPQAGVVKLRYKTSALTGTVPEIRVEINDHTVQSIPLSLDPTLSGLDIPISMEDIKVGYVKLTVRASVMPLDVRCFDERLFALHYIHILPETRVELSGLTN